MFVHAISYLFSCLTKFLPLSSSSFSTQPPCTNFSPLLPPTLVGTFGPTHLPNPTTLWMRMQLRYVTN